MNRNFLLVGMLSFVLLSLFTTASAQELDYTTAYEEGKKIFGTDYVAPRMDCIDNGLNCTLLIFDNSTNKLQLYRTTDAFESKTLVGTLVTDVNYANLININPATSVPYDVIYKHSTQYRDDSFGITLFGDSEVYHYYFRDNNLTSVYDFGCNDCYPYQVPSGYNSKYWRRLWAGNCTDNGTYAHWLGTSSGNDGGGLDLTPNSSCIGIGADYLAGIFIHRDGDYDFYTGYAYNSSSGAWNPVNNSDGIIGIDYDGVYESNAYWDVLTSYEYLIRNSTHVIEFDKDTSNTNTLYKFNGNEIIAQNRWIDSDTDYRQIIIYQNSTGIYRGTPKYETPTYSPAPQFTSPTLIRSPNYLFFVPLDMPYEIDVACTNNRDQCLAVVYVEGVLGNGIELYYTTDEFDTFNYKTTISADYSNIISHMDSNGDSEKYKLPLGVTWDSDSNKYYIVTKKKIYTYDLNTVTEIRDAGNWQYLGLINKQNENYAIKIHGSGQDICINAINIVSGSATSNFDCKTVVGGGVSVTYIKRAYGYLFTQNDDSPFGNVLIDTNYHYGWFWLGVGSGSDYDSTTQGTKPSPRTDVFYYDTTEDYIKYETDSIGKGVYQSYSNDLSTYLAPYPEYLYDLDINEKIHGYTNKRTERANYYSYTKAYDTYFARVRDTYVYKEPLYATITSNLYLKPKTDTYTSANMSVTMNCITTNETYIGYGNLLYFYHTCVEYNLTYESTTYKPTGVTLHKNYPTDCTSYLIDSKFLSFFDFEVTVANELTGSPLENAQVTFGGQTKMTDENGVATFNIFPLDGVSMNMVDSTACSEVWEANATATKNYFVTITKSGYTSIINEEVDVAEIGGGGEINLNDYEEFQLKPVGGSVLVRLRDKDGIEIENNELESSTSVSGNFTHALIIDPITGDPFIGTQSIGVPVEFYIISNASTFNVTVNFSYISFHDSKTVTIEQDDTETLWFKLNTSITNMECELNSDCLTDFCKGSFWHQLTGCIQGTCTYKDPEFCAGGCDDDVGCYQRKLDVTCDTDKQCPSNCTSDWVSYVGLCASDGYCVQIKDVCEEPCGFDENVGCNATRGICCESEECYRAGRRKYFFQLISYWNGGENSDLVFDYQYYCGIENRGERECISGTWIPILRELKEVTVASNPDSWGFKKTERYYKFFDISIYCGSNCEAEWVYCPYGCNLETGYCHHRPTEEINVTEKYEIDIYKPVSIIEDSLNETQIRESGLGFLLLLATPLFIVMMISILIGIGAGAVTKEPVLGALGFMASLVVFSVLQLFPIWIAIALIIVAGLIFSKMFLNFIRGS